MEFIILTLLLLVGEGAIRCILTLVCMIADLVERKEIEYPNWAEAL